jgi:hypothetical protein
MHFINKLGLKKIMQANGTTVHFSAHAYKILHIFFKLHHYTY